MNGRIVNINDIKAVGKAVCVDLYSIKAGEPAEPFISQDQTRGVLFTVGGETGFQIEAVLDSVMAWMQRKGSSVRFGLPVFVGRDIRQMASRLPVLEKKGLALINWQIEKNSARLPRELLWKASKLGIWNHVQGHGLFETDAADREWILNNPNIVHSFNNMDAQTREDAITPPEGLFSYGKLAPVPGNTLWKAVPTTAVLVSLLTMFTKKELLRMRFDNDTGNIWETGKQIAYYFERPETLSPGRMDEIVAMVDAGGSVDITHVRNNLATAYLIGYAVEKGVIVGNSSLKHPRKVFIERLKGMTGLDFSNCVERGYTSVRPEYRAMGIGARLLEGLTKRATDVKVFSIISEDNLATRKIAIRNNTRKIATYFSDKLQKKMGVWMPAHMIDEDGESGK